MGLEHPEQIAQGPGPQDELDVGSSQERTQQFELEVAGEGGHRADAEDLALLRDAVFEGVEQLLAAAEDRLGVVQGEPARLREFEPLIPPLEEFLAEALLELSQLDAQRGGGDVQVLGRAGQVARLRGSGCPSARSRGSSGGGGS
jgi:hypothetical protein